MFISKTVADVQLRVFEANNVQILKHSPNNTSICLGMRNVSDCVFNSHLKKFLSARRSRYTTQCVRVK